MDSEELLLDTDELNRVPAVSKVRLVLMACAILFSYGSYAGLGDINDVIFGFAFPALYIISGYLVMQGPDMDKRILRAIKRTAICFAALFIVDLAVSFFTEPLVTFVFIHTLSFWINFLFLNTCLLPIGSTIWFVQALLYAYIIIYILSKLKLLRFDTIIIGVCLLFTVLTGELAAVIGFHFRGLTYISGNFLTRALPYVLIGGFIQRKNDLFSKFPPLLNDAIGGVGILLAVIEYLILAGTGKNLYVGHIIGMGLVAVAICLNCFYYYTDSAFLHSELFEKLSSFELSIPFFLCSPVYYLLLAFGTVPGNEAFLDVFDQFAGILTLIISFVLGILYVFIRFAVLEVLSSASYAVESRRNRNQDGK